MPLASGADVKVGAYELLIARDAPNYYSHTLESNLVGRLDITGDPGKQGLRPDILLWSFSDWSGGEGSKFYDPLKPNVYWRGQANGRNPGELNPPPVRASGTTTAHSTPNKLMFCAASGNLYLGAGTDATAGGANHFFESSDGTTWASRDAGFVVNDTLTAMCSDGHFVYLSTITPTGGRKLNRFNPAGPSNAVFSTTATSSFKFFDMAFLPISTGGKVYGWNGKTLFEYDVTAALPVAASQVYQSGESTVPSGATGGIVAAENSVVFFSTVEGHSMLMEYGLGGSGTAKPLWHPPAGFKIKQIAYQLGTVFCGGDYLGKKALFALSLVTNQPLFIGYIRPTTSLTLADMCASFGSDLMILSNDGHAFIYNMSTDAISELDDATASGGTFAACTTYLGNRIAAKYSGTTLTTYTWGPDDGPQSTTQSSAPQLPAWDFGLPEDDKVLYGFHIVTSTLSVTNKVVISVQLEESGSYVDLNAITSGTANYLDVNTTNGFSSNYPTFRILRFKVTPSGNTDVYSVTARAGYMSFTDTWDMAIDLRPESYNLRRKIRTDRPSVIRADLQKIAALKGTLTFLNGMEFEKSTDDAWDGTTLADVPTKGYQSYTVAIDTAGDRLSPFQETIPGVLRLRLRSIAP